MAEWKFPVFGHGGDYNPDQWLDNEHVLEEDVRLMKLSHCNIMSVGIFAWAALEPCLLYTSHRNHTRSRI